ncbi:MAG: CBS domain-containing protein [Fimbriimonadaceae bacterium]|nr:CBS domain-containing protein [Chitinophagales bacterium]
MGEAVRVIGKSPKKRQAFISALLKDIEALEFMIEQNVFETYPIRIGAEQEICIVNEHWIPADNSIQILKDINHPSFTTELALYNLEINLEAHALRSGCLYNMEKELLQKFSLAREAAKKNNSELLLAGILPTISKNELTLKHLTPLERYRNLSKKLKDLRGDNFDLYLKGVDELHLRHDSIMFEACNTSFQTHLQVNPKEFVQLYNWCQAISAPVLAASTNSPILLGKELWSEIRIALFQQSIDTRHSIDEIREKRARVTFGNDWIYKSITEIYKEDIAHFEVLLTADDIDDAMELIRQKKIPSLKALRLHNSTVYRWNRPCYGVVNNIPHMRIECRYFPAGPTIKDEIANMALWVGLMKALPDDAKQIWNQFEFKDVKSNFVKVARAGIETVLVWRGKEISARQLLQKELIPLAHNGLRKCGLQDDEIYAYLSVIEKRLHTHTGSQWQIKNYRSLKKIMNNGDALISLTQAMHQKQKENIPVCEWQMIDTEKAIKERHKNMKYMHQLMTTDLLTVYPDDPLSLVQKIMLWYDVDHILVENKKGKLVGVITAGHIVESVSEKINLDGISVMKVMKKELITMLPDAEIESCLYTMQSLMISSLPIVQNDKLIGIVTKNDMLRWIALHV